MPNWAGDGVASLAWRGTYRIEEQTAADPHRGTSRSKADNVRVSGRKR